MFGQDDPNQNQTNNTDATGAPEPVADASLGDNSPATSPAPTEFNPTAFAPPAPSSPAVSSAPSDGGLLDIKQQALQQLTPLVTHLEQTPEEKFRTTMMMIQASDDQTLIKDAYESAKQITDEKVRAQALLDVVNEINYFTQQKNNS